MGTIYLGDIHGNFDFVSWYIKAHNISDCSIVQVGDFGIGFMNESNINKEAQSLKKLNDVLVNFNVTLYAIRGNHDNPKYFDGTFNLYERIHLMPDYSIESIEGKSHLFVGGAISIDRKYRTEGVDYWPEEKFKLDESKLQDITGIDVLVTHNSMSFLPPYSINQLVLDFASTDAGLLEQLLEERAAFTKMWDILTKENRNSIGLHVYGHFHFDETTFLNDTKHVLLSINKTYEHRH